MQTSSPTFAEPESKVPVISVPCPFRLNTLSTGKRKMLFLLLGRELSFFFIISCLIPQFLRLCNLILHKWEHFSKKVFCTNS